MISQTPSTRRLPFKEVRHEGNSANEPLAGAHSAGLAAGVGLAVALSACGGSSNPLSSAPASSGAPASGGALVIGSADFPESQILAEIYAGALNGAGVTATTKPNIGSREVYFKAVQDGSVDVVPDYSGNLLLYVNKDATEVSADDIAKALPSKLPQGLAVLDASKAEDKDAMVVTKATAEKYQLKFDRRHGEGLRRDGHRRPGDLRRTRLRASGTGEELQLRAQET